MRLMLAAYLQWCALWNSRALSLLLNMLQESLFFSQTCINVAGTKARTTFVGAVTDNVCDLLGLSVRVEKENAPTANRGALEHIARWARYIEIVIHLNIAPRAVFSKANKCVGENV